MDTSYSAPAAAPRPASAEPDKLRRDLAAMEAQIEQARRLALPAMDAAERQALDVELMHLELLHKQVRCS